MNWWAEWKETERPYILGRNVFRFRLWPLVFRGTGKWIFECRLRLVSDSNDVFPSVDEVINKDELIYGPVKLESSDFHLDQSWPIRLCANQHYMYGLQSGTRFYEFECLALWASASSCRQNHQRWCTKAKKAECCTAPPNGNEHRLASHVLRRHVKSFVPPLLKVVYCHLQLIVLDQSVYLYPAF